MKALLLVVFCFSTSFVWSQNLISDPGAEVWPTGAGWVQVSGNWQNGAPVTPHGGSFHFYASGSTVGSSSELYQDINVSAYASSIDAGTTSFTFSTWMRSYNKVFGVWNDLGNTIVEYRDASSTVLSTYSTGNQASLTWIQFSDTRLAPVGTRTIRIRLISYDNVGTDSDGYFDDLVLTKTTTLPVSLISFTSLVVGSAIELKWQTASEVSNDFFTVEKSIDGLNWTVLSVQKGKLNAQQLTNYETIDEQPIPGIQYYKLKQTDVDGTTTTYPLLAQTYTEYSQPEITVFPNPSDADVTVYMPGEGLKKINVFSITGQVLLPEKEVEGNECFLEWHELPAGYYVIEVSTALSVQRKIVVKR